jgi:hypothetical protein
MTDMLLDIRNDLPGIGFIPASVQVLRHRPQLDDQIAGKVLWLDFAAFLAPKP